MAELPLETKTIPVTIDKSHLITIGEKLYTEKVSFVRELVNNAYDADATAVHISISANEVTIRDNGCGMDEQGLRQYFTIGSNFKKEQNLSPHFHRQCIGEFGIGKFAALAACKQFEVETQRGSFRAKLIFDKERWAQHEDWHLNIDVLNAISARGDGTTITLHNVNIQLPLTRVRRYLAERTPIQAPNFAVFLNREQVTSDIITGQQLPFETKTPYGLVEGNIIITPTSNRPTHLGLAVLVKGVLVRYETFGLEISRKAGATKLTGKVRADFLPISSSRDDFIRDSQEFEHFTEVVKKQVNKALQLVREEADEKATLQASRVLKDALAKIGKVVRRYKDLFPETQVPLGTAANKNDPQATAGYEISKAQFLPPRHELDPGLQDKLKATPNKKIIQRSSGMLGSKSVIRTLQVAGMDIAVRLEHLSGEDESLVSGGVIYINLDHPLYRTYQNNDTLLTQHVARIITKELTLKTGVRDAEQAFALQSNLLTDAMKENS